MVNDHTAFRTDWMPFAGRRHSGYGIGGIPWSMREMTQEKMIVLRDCSKTHALRVAPIFGPRYVAKLVRSAPATACAWLLAIFRKLTAT